MIIACPACATRYVVPDSAIGIHGRTVRCAKCRHSWFQEGSDSLIPPPPVAVDTPPPAPPPPPAPASAPPLPPEPAAQAEPEPAGGAAKSEIEAEQSAAPPEPPAPSRPAEHVGAPPSAFAAEDLPPPPAPRIRVAEPQAEHSPFDPEPPFRPRRNTIKLWTYAAVVFAVFALGTTAAVSYWGVPDWVPVNRPTFGAQQPDLVLDFPADRQERRQLPNGTEFFGASGTVTNVGRETRTLPPILIVMRDAQNRIVYSWEVAPPQNTLAPGESVTINEAVTDVPEAAKFAEIGWKPG